ncbi:DUF885 domain-containing protein [Trueperella bialowiezensis]|uniref:Bacterial protein of uncharacterized function (DUF885) n=1 Tax=Trueperella bialowiezensis TaxID=312285 RepID=A0A3S4VST8_9ACTO|nr:DUF885 domain-containing protein [Trueperella bialowiezensis]VEI12942.1 Bacterial protein of uncharacterised function (DUF885) [Trueperella bialowiezensis]
MSSIDTGRPARPDTPIDECANRYVANLLACTPELVTSLGRGTADERDYTDYSPDGEAAMADLNRSTLREITALAPHDDVDAVTKAALIDDLERSVEFYDRGEYGDINVIATPLQSVHEIFDNMAQDTAEDWEIILSRLRNVDKALSGWSQSLTARADAGPPLATKQIELAIDQAESIAGADSPLASLALHGAGMFADLGDDLVEAADQARGAYSTLADFLRTNVLPVGVGNEAFGRERYELRIRSSTGATLDLDETYEWGVHELARIVAEQESIARELYGPGVSVTEAMERLNADPAYQIHGSDNLQAWMQEVSDQALSDLHGTHFDIPDPLRALECMIAPSGTGAIYYTGPTDDFSRGGRMWWSVPDGTDVFHTWQEKTTVYHEGVPGHHLQIGMATYMKDSLNDWRRNISWNSGHGEGWALYAEGLMAELGYHNDPADYMGVLDSERLRATRVVLDIGFHLGKPSPAGYEHISPVWNREVAWQFLQDNVAMDRSFLAFELNRYLGWAGQAPSYKVGHRLWKQLRAEAEARPGFNLKDWHMKALQIGSVGLDVMRDALAGPAEA